MASSDSLQNHRLESIMESETTERARRDAQSGALPKTTAAPNYNAKMLANATIIALTLMGLFWIGIGLLQFLVGLYSFTGETRPDLGYFFFAFWNIAVSAINVLQIRHISRREKVAVKNLGILAVLGTLWGIFWLGSGGWVQWIAILLYVALGILVFMNRDYYTELTPREKERLARKSKQGDAVPGK